MVEYNIISTGSKGNAVVVDDRVLIDCGVPFKSIQPHLKYLQLVLLTHIHSDHFRPSTIRRMARERPMLRFGCCPWMVAPLVDAGVSKSNIDLMTFGVMIRYRASITVEPVPLSHDVPNCGYKIGLPAGNVFYATDTANLNGISAPNYDLYLVEANYEEEEIMEKISEHKANGEYAYERRVLNTHLSKAQCDDFIYSNIGPTGQYVYLHCHQDKEETP